MRWPLQVLVLSIALLPAAPAHADYGVGRLSSVQGVLSVQTPGDPEAHPGVVNEVLAEGDQLATGENSGAELQFSGVVIELAPATLVALTRVDTDALAIYVARGSAALGRASERQPASAVLQGLRSVVYTETAGRYRLDVWPDQSEEAVTVRLGRATVEVESRDYTLVAGEALRLAPELGGNLSVYTAGAYDTLDLALTGQLRSSQTSALAQRLSPDWIGAPALDDQGNWLEVTSVGPLWVPFFLPAGWAPYHTGQWVWNGVWGWTWVDALPWAYLPYHFGRWIWWNNRWAWSPQGRIPAFSPGGFCPPGVLARPIIVPRRLAAVVPAAFAAQPTPATSAPIANQRPRVAASGPVPAANPGRAPAATLITLPDPHPQTALLLATPLAERPGPPARRPNHPPIPRTGAPDAFARPGGRAAEPLSAVTEPGAHAGPAAGVLGPDRPSSPEITGVGADRRTGPALTAAGSTERHGSPGAGHPHGSGSVAADRPTAAGTVRGHAREARDSAPQAAR